MIDTIRFKTKIAIQSIKLDTFKKGIKFKQKKYKYHNTSHITQLSEEYYYTFIDSTRLAYYPSTQSLIISGKIISSYSNDKISNFDDVFYSKQELDIFFDQLNSKINKYLINNSIDVRKLKITRIDYCFNVFTPFVNEYIEFFNICYKKNAGQKFNKLTNYTTTMDKPINSSCYLKTNGDFSNNTTRNYVVNFYNKSNELINRMNEQIDKYGHSQIDDEILGNSVNILRLEVQVDYNLLKRICSKFNINKKNHNLEYLFDMDIAKFVIEEKIKNLFTSCDFYAYDKVKQILIEQGYARNDKIFTYIYKISQHQQTSSYKKYENILKSLNIYPYMFIPSKWKIEKLENPIKLLEEKIEMKQTYNLKLSEGGERVC